MSEYAICGGCYQRLGAVNELEARIEELEAAITTYVDDSYRPTCIGDAERFDALAAVVEVVPFITPEHKTTTGVKE